MGVVVDLAHEKTKRKIWPHWVDRASLTMRLLEGPITAAVVDALEHLSDHELEAFFRARARAKLRGPHDDRKEPA